MAGRRTVDHACEAIGSSHCSGPARALYRPAYTQGDRRAARHGIPPEGGRSVLISDFQNESVKRPQKAVMGVSSQQTRCMKQSGDFTFPVTVGNVDGTLADHWADPPVDTSVGSVGQVSPSVNCLALLPNTRTHLSQQHKQCSGHTNLFLFFFHTLKHSHTHAADHPGQRLRMLLPGGTLLCRPDSAAMNDINLPSDGPVCPPKIPAASH